MINENLFIGKTIRLAAPREGDAAVMQKWYEDAAFMRSLDTDVARLRTVADMKEELENAAKSKNDFHFQIRLLETDELVGFIVLDGVEWTNGCCMLGIGIGPREYRGIGYGSEAIRLVLQYAFTELNLHRVGLNFISYNDRAQRVYERAGFRYEGTVREFVHRDGGFYDLVFMGILQKEWLALQKGNGEPAAGR